MDETENPVNAYVQSNLQLCFCGDKATPLPVEPLACHNIGCLTWDWAVSNKKQSGRARLLQLDHYAKTIGDPGGESDTETSSGEGDPPAQGDDGDVREGHSGTVRDE